jgi:hypothetical protein
VPRYYVIKISNLLAGVDSITQYLVLSLAIWIFKTYLIDRNWRTVSYVSVVSTSLLNFLWVLPFYNVAGLRNGMFTV